ncbi:hypothetical protein BDN71DRAFT_1437526 [Pleurotus eryngii]|uniref:Uncharacterized protein n=1 Tax=Pleurotus eryngii TaxID=5323 RepID=A0A9P6A8G6_PLEER|nr:hypothetical protein BDN71DRAFT_1437526 [Pleurotus eryngii]
MPSLGERRLGSMTNGCDLEAGRIRARLVPRAHLWVHRVQRSDGLKKAVVFMYFSIAMALVITGVELRGRFSPDTGPGSHQGV